MRTQVKNGLTVSLFQRKRINMQVKETLWTLEKELSIAPSLEIIFRLKSNTQTDGIYDALFPLLHEFDAFPFSDEKCITIISHDTDQGGWPGALSMELWLTVMNEMKAASRRKIRKKQTVFKVCREETLTQNYIDGISVSLSQNTFPDQACVISLQISTSRENAWQHLQRIRDNVIASMDECFFWASLGYKFVMNPFARISADQMKASCMRYLGVDLHDVVCIQNGWWWNKLRTVNWQTTLNTIDVTRDGWDATPHIVSYQTGYYPSVCDRNNVHLDNLTAINEYKIMAEKLSSWILNTDEMGWSEKWNAEIYARWARRWDEVK